MVPVSILVNSRRPGWSLKQPFYIDPTVFQLDLERVFSAGWLFAGHACQIKKPGEYFCYEVAGDSLIIIRGKDEKIRALFNVCRHRGSIICKKSAGQPPPRRRAPSRPRVGPCPLGGPTGRYQRRRPCSLRHRRQRRERGGGVKRGGCF